MHAFGDANKDIKAGTKTCCFDFLLFCCRNFANVARSLA